MTLPTSTSNLKLKHIPDSKLYVSEPNPSWFGNKSNEARNSSWNYNESKNWLKSRFHFSFAEYNSYLNTDFGVLRVMNDDFVQPNRGFGTHGHANMEIVTYIVHGSLTHKDSMGTEESLGRGSVQFMTAGRGVQHSEYNLSSDKTLRFIQTWINPRKRGLVPNYGSFDPKTTIDLDSKVCASRNQWRHLMSDAKDTSTTTPVQIEQDANLFVAEMDKGQSLTLKLKENRMAYVLCVEGSVNIKNGGSSEVALQRHDACEITPASSNENGNELVFEAVGSEIVEGGEELGAHVLVFEMEHVPGAGRRDF